MRTVPDEIRELISSVGVTILALNDNENLSMDETLFFVGISRRLRQISTDWQAGLFELDFDNPNRIITELVGYKAALENIKHRYNLSR
jgi:hypothetical protein